MIKHFKQGGLQLLFLVRVYLVQPPESKLYGDIRGPPLEATHEHHHHRHRRPSSSNIDPLQLKRIQGAAVLYFTASITSKAHNNHHHGHSSFISPSSPNTSRSNSGNVDSTSAPHITRSSSRHHIKRTELRCRPKWVRRTGDLRKPFIASII